MNESSEFIYGELRQFVKEKFGLYFPQSKEVEFKEKLAPLLRKLNLDVARFNAIVRYDINAQNALIEALTIGETYFFRNQPHFEALKSYVFPELIKRNEERKKLSIWSAGCATGEEPYSVAMHLAEHFPQLQSWEISITATDVNNSFLARAREAVYNRWSFRMVEPTVIERNFTPNGDNTFKLSPSIRDKVSFMPLNLTAFPYPPPFSNSFFDLILCRNVLIYFSMETVDKIISLFHEALKPGGYLFVGHSESFKSLNVYKTHYLKGTFFFSRRTKEEAASVAKTEQISLSGRPAPFHLKELATLSLTNPGIPLPSAEKPKTTIPASPAPRAAVPPPAAPTIPAPATSFPTYADARRFADAGEFPKARETLQQLLAKDPDDLRSHMLLAIVAEQQSNLELAIKHLKAAVFLDKTLIIGHYSLGTIYERQTKYDLARRYYQNARKLLEDNRSTTEILLGEGMSVDRLREILDARIKELSSIGMRV